MPRDVVLSAPAHYELSRPSGQPKAGPTTHYDMTPMMK